MFLTPVTPGARGSGFSLAAGALLSLVSGWNSAASAQCGSGERQLLTARDAERYEEFGYAVATDGDVAVVGARHDDEVDWYGGSAYVLRFDGSSWVEEQKLIPAVVSAQAAFGSAVAVDGDLAVVGAPWDIAGNGRGSAFVFRFDGSSWVEEHKLLSSATRERLFGSAVDVESDRILVGASWNSGDEPGRAYLFGFDGVTWNEEQILTAHDEAVHDDFGAAVALDGDRIAIGAPLDDDACPADIGCNSGSVYLFGFDGSAWSEEHKLTALGTQQGDEFGASIALSGEDLVVGAPQRATNTGEAYVFGFDGAAWSQLQKLRAGDGELHDRFGAALALDERVIVVGAPFDRGAGGQANAGAGYVFRLQGSTWVARQKFMAGGGAGAQAGAYVGTAVAITGEYALLGAPGLDLGWAEEGAVYAFLLPELGLDAEPNVVSEGDRVTFTTCGGLPGGLTLLAAVELNGIPYFGRVALGTFDGNGEWRLGGNVPPGLTGLIATFRTYGLAVTGKVAESNRETVTFQ